MPGVELDGLAARNRKACPGALGVLLEIEDGVLLVESDADGTRAEGRHVLVLFIEATRAGAQAEEARWLRCGRLVRILVFVVAVPDPRYSLRRSILESCFDLVSPVRRWLLVRW